MGSRQSFRASDVVVTFCDEVLDLAPGSDVTATRNQDDYSDRVGAQGDVVRVRSHDRTGSVVVSTLDKSRSVAQLGKAIANDRIGRLVITDRAGKTLVTGENAYLNNSPSGGPSVLRWQFDIAELSLS